MSKDSQRALYKVLKKLLTEKQKIDIEKENPKIFNESINASVVTYALKINKIVEYFNKHGII